MANDYTVSTVIIGLFLLLSLKFPVVAQLFMLLLLIVGYVNMRSADKYVKGACHECKLYDNDKDLCLYTSNGVCMEDCKAFRIDSRGEN